MMRPQASLLADRRRLHLNHGPIDLIIEAFGAPGEVEAAYGQAVTRFQTMLDELVAELPVLRQPARRPPRCFTGPTASRMEQASSPFAPVFITPMAAVAGSVADEMLAALCTGRVLAKAYVNNGGDSALYLARGQSLTLAIAGTGNAMADRITIHAASSVRGVATSGWRGRSHSLGIADAVTVLARSAAAADAAATLIANAVDCPGHPAVTRMPASALSPDSDLGDRVVTTSVGALSRDDIAAALDAGRRLAEHYCRQGLIEAAALFLHGAVVTAGNSGAGWQIRDMSCRPASLGPQAIDHDTARSRHA